MRIIFLNTWNGKTGEAFNDFIRAHVSSADIFCFQEVYDPLKPALEGLLPGWTSIYGYKSAGKNDDFPQATYVRAGLTVRSSRLLLEGVLHAGVALYTEVVSSSGVYHLCNVHGVAQPGAKRDTPGRITQSRVIIDHLRDLKGKKIIGGDFNLLPDTKSIRIFEESGYADLIAQHGITTTRNRLAWDLYPSEDRQYHSDYVFTGSGVGIRNFVVPENEVSDHLPLILDTDD